MGEYALTAVLGTTAVVLLVAVLALSAQRRPAALRSLLWRAALGAFWLVPLVCLAARFTPSAAPSVRLPVPDALLEDAPAAPPLARAVHRDLPAAAGRAQALRSAASARPRLDARGLLCSAWPLVWALGALAMLLGLLHSGFAVHRLLLGASSLEDALPAVRTAHWARTMGLRNVPPVRVSDRVDCPTVGGLFRPVLLLPRRVPAAHEHLDAALVHELAHILRRDSAPHLVSRLTRAVWWWHPLAWLIAGRLSEAAEEACDDWVIALTGNREAYAHAVTGWAEATCPAHTLACARRGAPLLRRVRRILDASRALVVRPSQVARFATVLGVAAAAIAVSCLRVGAGPARDGEWRVKTFDRLDYGITWVAPPEDLAGVITGHVFLPDGVTPAIGASVFAENSNDGPAGRQVPPDIEPDSASVPGSAGTPKTDGNGGFSIPISKRSVGPGEAFFVHAHLAGYAPLRSSRVEVGGSVRLVLASGYSIAGQVVGHSGQPTPGIRVAAYWPSFRGGAREAAVAADGLTGSDGRYQIGPLGAGKYDVWATGPEVAPVCRQDVPVPATGAGPVLRLAVPAEIRGQVVYLGTRTPVDGVEVSTYMMAAGQSRDATSDAGGRFVLRGLPPGKYRLRLDKNEPLRYRNFRMSYTPGRGYGALSGEVAGGVKLAENTVEVRLYEGQVLERSFPTCEGGTIEGRVLTADGQPVAGAEVSLVQIVRSNMPDYTPAKYLAKHPVSFSHWHLTDTDPEGRFRLEHVWPRSYYLEAKSRDGHCGLSGLFRVQDRETTSIDVTITDATASPTPDVPQSLRDELWR